MRGFSILNGLLLLSTVFGFFSYKPDTNMKLFAFKRYYPISRYQESYLRKLNSKNSTIQTNSILNNNNNRISPGIRLNRLLGPGKKSVVQKIESVEKEEYNQKLTNKFLENYEDFSDEYVDNEDEDDYEKGGEYVEGEEDEFDIEIEEDTNNEFSKGGFRIIINQGMLSGFGGVGGVNMEDDGSGMKAEYDAARRSYGKRQHGLTSENFQVVTNPSLNFSDIGGYDNIKSELRQCVDILSNYKKYKPFNVRVPKGLILEGPPGNGKTMFAKALAGEAKTGFITVSGSEFQEKYVGVGASRIRELFKLAQTNTPCIIFIDEIDALGRKRSSDGETSGTERDNTLNELLVALDGFKNTSGVFVIGATNRADLLDSALIRPGRIDKRIFIGNPDTTTRRAILNIHISGKPHDSSVVIEDLVEMTNGLSGAQLENLVNEAMLNALRYDRKHFTNKDIDEVMNKIMVGWQPSEHQFTANIIDRIAVHEMGHAVVGLLSKHHSKMTKVVINLSAPNSPAYTIFEASASSILTREALFEHLMILLSGRIAEEVIYGVSVTTGAINDFEEALKLAERMICYYGMGKQQIYPSTSEKYKEIIDTEVSGLIQEATEYADFIVRNSKELILEGAEILKDKKVLTYDTLIGLVQLKYDDVFSLTQFLI